ncbi:helix-turn-helix domain-containing protein [Roseibium sp. AS2]|uniref:helix-turn-helix domain-containing protein n=1 Tax=Roseibium sp. AS2 TaxID=3135781 RepID=UPI00317F04CD
MFKILPPARDLATLVQGYWFVEDLPGDHAGAMIRTSPVPYAVLSVNIGRPNSEENGRLVPDVALLGLQSQNRSWCSWSDTYFVMVMLTVSGLVRLFSHTGPSSADRLLDLGAVTGDGPAKSLKSSVGAALTPLRIAGVLDQWLISRLSNIQAVPESRQIAMAHHALHRGETVETAAKLAEVDRRQLNRLFQRHLGVGPKELASLERLHSSLQSVQAGSGDSKNGFSDQAHQTRSWRRRLGVTPGAYSRTARTQLTEHFGTNNPLSGIAYYF